MFKAKTIYKMKLLSFTQPSDGKIPVYTSKAVSGMAVSAGNRYIWNFSTASTTIPPSVEVVDMVTNQTSFAILDYQHGYKIKSTVAGELETPSRIPNMGSCNCFVAILVTQAEDSKQYEIEIWRGDGKARCVASSCCCCCCGSPLNVLARMAVYDVPTNISGEIFYLKATRGLVLARFEKIEDTVLFLRIDTGLWSEPLTQKNLLFVQCVGLPTTAPGTVSAAIWADTSSHGLECWVWQSDSDEWTLAYTHRGINIPYVPNNNNNHNSSSSTKLKRQQFCRNVRQSIELGTCAIYQNYRYRVDILCLDQASLCFGTGLGGFLI